MAKKSAGLQRIIRMYREKTGRGEVDMHDVANFAAAMGYPLPKPSDPIDLLAKELSSAARQESRRDKETGLPYRANQSFTERDGDKQLTLWVDTDQATRQQMRKASVNRREQMIGDGLQLTLDVEHWNRIHPDDEPIVMLMDLTPDIEWRRNSPLENAS